MPDELSSSSDFFTDVRRILANARRNANTANLHPSRTLATLRDFIGNLSGK